MTMTRLWNVVAVVAVLLILLLGYVVGVSPALTAASDSDNELLTVEATNQVKMAELDALKALAEDSDSLFADLEEFNKIVPSGHNSSVFASQLESLAAAAGVQIESIAYVTAVEALAPTEAVDTSTEAADDESETDDADTEVAEPVAPVTPTTSSVAGLVALDVSIQVTGSFEDVNKFLQSVQNNQRAFSVSSVQVDADSDDGVADMVLLGSVYVLSSNVGAVSASVSGEVVN
ncbi:hypothetical protein [Salinibacterium sp. NK8237]|uniref:hypothetical protein n=1 Tax=Salinibacterium sp. NK8237 TaxID=2792038 RepID=UPI0018CD519A|nr:hypothetical protein [Salinibacterium sp. NK8237]MBH0129935.1 hypothetical protein [Salinibacterium sp. NK8237]